MMLHIDPPVGPFHSAAAIRAWIQELDETRVRYAGDPEALADIARAREDAEHWLVLTLEPYPPPSAAAAE